MYALVDLGHKNAFDLLLKEAGIQNRPRWEILLDPQYVTN
jgi:hypothetical protein